MRSTIACVAAALALDHVPAMAQPAGDSMDRLRACASLPIAERTRCLDQLSRTLGAEPAPSRPATGPESTTAPENWVFSETTSPVDYSPVVVATATAGAPAGSGMKLSISCRGGSTYLLLGSPAGLPAGDRYVVWYTIDGGSAKALPALITSSGLALSGDIAGLLLSLPPQGEIGFRIVGRYDVKLEGRYSLAGLKTTRDRMAVPCKWQTRTDAPRQ